MATTPVEELLEAARRLTREERAQLRTALTKLDLADGRGSGAAFVDSLLSTPPLDADGLDEMERAIEEGCERIDPRDW